MTAINNNIYPIKVSFRKSFSLLFLIMGTVLLLLQVSFFFIESITVNYVGLISAVMIIIVGYRYYTGTYFEVEPNKITVKNLHGGIYKQYGFANTSKLSYSNNEIYIEITNGTKKLRLSKLMANQNDWDVVKKEILKYDFGKELHDDL